MKLYGIPNCTTVKKARAWFAAHDIAVEFHDFRKNGITQAWLQEVARQTGWEALVNRRGTTWRQLADAERNAVSSESAAIELMLAKPSVIKRPVLERDGRYHLGFDEQHYQDLFGA